MKVAPLHPQEPKRLKALLDYEVLDSEDEAVFDELTELASNICGTQISLISLIDHDRQWFKSRVGLDAKETPRNVAFCSHAILQEQVFEVPNALEDERFFDNPLVTEDPDIRFYAGAPLVTDNGYPLGTLCVIDREPKRLTDDQRRALEILAKQVISQLELRIRTRKLERINEQRGKMFAVVAHDLRGPFNGIMGMSKILKSKADSLKPDRIMHAAEGILESSFKVFQLLDELLQWTKNELGAFQIEPTGMSMKQVCESTISFLSDALELKGVTLNMEIDRNVKVVADKTLVKTVLRNLIANSIKYTPKQGLITIVAEVDESMATITVKDTGRGIAKAIRDNLFSDYVTSEIGTKGEKGSGMGLKLCGDFIRKMDGDIWVNDCEQGASISFTLPIYNG